MKSLLPLVAILLAGLLPSKAADLYSQDHWAAMAADRSAHAAGDILTVIVYETASAQNTASSGSKRSSQVGGHIGADAGFAHSASLGLQNDSDASGSTGRSGGMVAQISVTVESVLPNGDLRVAGEQQLNINGDRTNIRIRGRVRQADISNNAVLSNRLADATIDYDGTGFVSNSAKPGLVARIFNWLGL